MTFGEKLRRLRKERGMSQEDLAGALGVSRQAVSRWELGEVAADTANVLAVSQLFGVSTDYLLLDGCCDPADTPAVRDAQETLRQRQMAAGKGLLCRCFWLAPAALYHLYRIQGQAPYPMWWLLILAAVTGIWLVRLNGALPQKARKTLWITDLAAFGGVFLLPFLLGGAMGTWAVLAGQLTAVLPMVYSIKTLRVSLGLPWKSRRIFRWEI